MHRLTLTDLPMEGKKILMRVDFNVPLDSHGHIEDDTRIRAALPSIKYVLEQGGSVIMMSHLGRPDGKRKASLSLKPCADALSHLLNKEVLFAPDCIGDETKRMCSSLSAGAVVLLENVRFHPQEELGDEKFAKELASLGDLYVDDAFGSAHREHASVVTITKFFPDSAAAGFLMEKEIEFLSMLLHAPERPFCAVIGGAKISTKIGTLKALVPKVDTLIIGGAMAYTFLKCQGMDVGSSLCEDKYLEAAAAIIEECKNQGVKLLLPVDSVATKELTDDATTVIYERNIPSGYIGADIGPQTIKLFNAAINESQTILWNGPMGVFEKKPFAHGTEAIAKSISASNGVTVAGGGDTLSAIAAVGIGENLTHISTGGGASLEFLELGTLPGVEALTEKAAT
jgi:phosphoglycerate kinase